MSNEKHVCNVDSAIGEINNSCVLDYNKPEDCDEAIKLLNQKKTKLDCPHWIILEVANQSFLWKPIKTVPRNGSSFIAYNGKDMEILNWPKGHALGKWTKPKSSKKYDGYAVEFPNPTYWTHLPSPPEETE